MRGKHIFDNPVFDYTAGEKVLVILDHEEDTAVMGGGYYPLFEGSFVINDNVAISQAGEQTTLNKLNSTINHVLNNDAEQLDCFLTEYWDGTKCVPHDFEMSVESEQHNPHPGLGLLNQAERKNADENKILLSNSDEETFSPKQIAIKKIQDALVSDSSYDELRQIIQNQIDKNTLEQFSAVFLKDMRQEFNEGEKISFNLVNFGYRDWCLMPAISVYHEDHMLPIYEDAIVHTCPAPMENPTPRISIFDEQDFRTFPSCQFEGRYTIWGESFEFKPQVIGSFYCNSSEKFKAPETFEIIIPQSSSNFENNFVPSELKLRYGDNIKIINQDDNSHYVILFIDKQAGTVVFGIRINPGESFTEPVYRLGTFELASLDENEEKYPGIHGVITVTED